MLDELGNVTQADGETVPIPGHVPKTELDDPAVAAALYKISATPEYKAVVGAKRAADDAAQAAAVASKQRKLVESSAAIAAQPRLGATNSVPAAKQASKVAPAPRGNIASFFGRG